MTPPKGKTVATPSSNVCR